MLVALIVYVGHIIPLNRSIKSRNG